MNESLPHAAPGDWVAFDFDGTLTRHDTLLPFLRQVLGTARLARVLALEAPWLAAYASRLVSNEAAKVRILRRALGGLHRDELHAQGAEFARRRVPRMLREDRLRRLREHLDAGQRCVLVTASLTLYTRPWGVAQGFTEVIGSELEFDAEGRAIGSLAGGNCWGPEKERRLRQLLGGAPLSEAYGDSRGDREMLRMARKANLFA